jgi:hypothetical protein
VSPSNIPTSGSPSVSPSYSPSSSLSTGSPSATPSTLSPSSSPTSKLDYCTELLGTQTDGYSCDLVSRLQPKLRKQLCKDPRFCPDVCNNGNFDCVDSTFPFYWHVAKELKLTCSEMAALKPKKILKMCNQKHVRSLCPSVCNQECIVE